MPASHLASSGVGSGVLLVLDQIYLVIGDWRCLREAERGRERLQSKKFDSFSDLGLRQLLIPILPSLHCQNE